MSSADPQKPWTDAGHASWAWPALAALHVAGSWLLAWLPATAQGVLDWQPALELREPWRAFTAVWVHWSDAHLLLNIAAAAVVAALGWAGAVSRAGALAWFIAWPLSQLLMLALPTGTAHHAGLSGVLHAGVAVAAVWLVARDHGRRRAVGVALLAGLAAKLAWEWQRGPTPIAGTEALASPAAHLAGTLAGVLAALAMLAYAQGSRGPRTRLQRALDSEL